MTESSQKPNLLIEGHRTAKGHEKSGCRIVHVAVPEQIFNHAKAQAYLSGLPWPRFVEKLLERSVTITE